MQFCETDLLIRWCESGSSSRVTDVSTIRLKRKKTKKKRKCFDSFIAFLHLLVDSNGFFFLSCAYVWAMRVFCGWHSVGRTGSSLNPIVFIFFFWKIIFVCVMNSWIEAHPVDSLSSDELFLIYHSESTGRERRAAKWIDSLFFRGKEKPRENESGLFFFSF